jgi:hypothetical protein
MLQIYQLKFKYGDTMTVASLLLVVCNAEGAGELVTQSFPNSLALAKQAQKHTACLEAHDQMQNYSCLSVWSVYFCLTPVL